MQSSEERIAALEVELEATRNQQELIQAEWEMFQRNLVHDYRLVRNALYQHVSKEIFWDVVYQLSGRFDSPPRLYPLPVAKWIQSLEQRSVERDEFQEAHDDMVEMVNALVELVNVMIWWPGIVSALYLRAKYPVLFLDENFTDGDWYDER